MRDGPGRNDQTDRRPGRRRRRTRPGAADDPAGRAQRAGNDPGADPGRVFGQLHPVQARQGRVPATRVAHDQLLELQPGQRDAAQGRPGQRHATDHPVRAVHERPGRPHRHGPAPALLQLRRRLVGLTMDSETRMSVRRSLIPLALAACATAAAVSCGDPSPVGLEAPAVPQAIRWSSPATKGSGLVACLQTYDSVTQRVGPAGGLIAVGHHYLWVDSMALSDTVSITAVAPADTVRWVRFQPDGLQFRTNGAGWSALLYTSFTDCRVTTAEPHRSPQVTDN